MGHLGNRDTREMYFFCKVNEIEQLMTQMETGFSQLAVLQARFKEVFVAPKKAERQIDFIKSEQARCLKPKTPKYLDGSDPWFSHNDFHFQSAECGTGERR